MTDYPKKPSKANGKKSSGWVAPDNESSTIKFMKWDAGNLLSVEFQSGKKYQYKNVTRDKFNEFKSASSAGSWHFRNIKTKEAEHPYEII